MSVNKVFDVALDIKRPSANRDFTVVNGDSGNRINISLSDGGSPVKLTGCRVIAAFLRPDGCSSMQDSGVEGSGVTLSTEDSSAVAIYLSPASFSPGIVECELQIYSDDTLSTLVTTARFNFTCREAIVNENTVQAAPELPLLKSLYDKLSNIGVSAVALQTGAKPTAELKDEDEKKVLTLGIPAGPKGDKGDAGPVSVFQRSVLSGTQELTLRDEHEYYITNVGSIEFFFPQEEYFECWISLCTSADESRDVLFPADAEFIGSDPDWNAANSKFEISVKDGVVISKKVE